MSQSTDRRQVTGLNLAVNRLFFDALMVSIMCSVRGYTIPVRAHYLRSTQLEKLGVLGTVAFLKFIHIRKDLAEGRIDTLLSFRPR